MKTLQAPRTDTMRTAASIPVLLMLSVLGSTAIGATDIQAPCPEAGTEVDTLHAIISAANVDATSVIRTVDAHETTAPASVLDAETAVDKAEQISDADTSPQPDTATPTYTTRLPGVSVNDMPGFRRHMFRTDI